MLGVRCLYCLVSIYSVILCACQIVCGFVCRVRGELGLAACCRVHVAILSVCGVVSDISSGVLDVCLLLC